MAKAVAAHDACHGRGCGVVAGSCAPLRCHRLEPCCRGGRPRVLGIARSVRLSIGGVRSGHSSRQDANLFELRRRLLLESVELLLQWCSVLLDG